MWTRLMETCSKSNWIDMNWKTLASPGDNVIVFIEDSGDVEIGDEVVIEDEHLCLKKNKQTLNCDIILCRV